jgi:DNA-binding response OmpR family regulator
MMRRRLGRDDSPPGAAFAWLAPCWTHGSARYDATMSEERRASILIVDDDASVRELLKLQLVGEGYEVELADDAIVAGRALMRTPPDLMLVDVAMPYLDGLDFVATLKADTTVPDVPVVFITGHGEVLSRAQALGVECLMKPFTAEELLEVVRRELQLRPPRRRARLDYLSAST